MTDQVKKVCVIGAGVMGAGIAAHVANAGVRCCCSTSCPGTVVIATRSPRARWRRCSRPIPPPSCPRVRRSWSRPAISRSSRPGRRMRLGGRGGRRAARHQAGALCAAGAGEAAGHRVSSTPRPSRWKSWSRAGRTSSRPTSSSPFLQSAALHAADRDRARPAQRRRVGRQGRGFRRPVPGQRIVRARIRPASSPIASAPIGLAVAINAAMDQG